MMVCRIKIFRIFKSFLSQTLDSLHCFVPFLAAPQMHAAHDALRALRAFDNALRPNSAVRQLFPTAVLHTAVQPQPTAQLTHEALRAFEESKRSHLKATIVHSDSETDTIRRTIERNALRRSLIKYEPK